MKVNRKGNRGFTLVEILIVVVILGILAAIVVPQFTNAANDARQGNVFTQTSTLENQIELYAARNDGNYPDLVADQWGAVGDAQDPPTMIGGGYIKSPPVNPHAPAAQGTIVVNANFADPADADAQADVADPAAGGWMYDSSNGILRAAGADYLNDG